jgi:hypothetical protein
MTVKDVQFKPERWIQFWDNYKGLEHQIKAIRLLGEHINEADPCLLTEGAEWVERWRSEIKDVPNTWAGVEQAAKAAGAKFPELVAAQWCLESGSGQHTSGRNNYFGLKGPGTQSRTQEVVNGKTITITDEFLDFRGLQECVQYLVDRWYRDWHGHKGVNNSSSREAAARELQRQGYATNPAYADRLIALMKEHRPAAGAALVRNPLSVKWQSQLDNKSGTGYRECFSSSCAMLAMYWGKVASDDAYNVVRAKYGDTTDAQAQLAALRSLGLKADFFTNGTPAALEREIDAGRPVAVGWLHKGPSSSPTGTGHWSVVIGYTDAAWIQNDPNGEALLVQGGYTNNTKGAGVAYSRKNWNPRWMPGGSGGWYLICKP